MFSGFDLFHFDHLVYSAMALHAAHAGCNVRLVIKVDEVGKPMNLHPRDRLAGRIAVAHLLEPRACGLTRVWQFMQTSVGGTAAKPALLDGVVAVVAVHAEIAAWSL